MKKTLLLCLILGSCCSVPTFASTELNVPEDGNTTFNIEILSPADDPNLPFELEPQYELGVLNSAKY